MSSLVPRRPTTRSHECPKCDRPNDPLMAKCVKCNKRFHTTCVLLSRKEELTLEFRCFECMVEMQTSRPTKSNKALSLKSGTSEKKDEQPVYTPSKRLSMLQQLSSNKTPREIPAQPTNPYRTIVKQPVDSNRIVSKPKKPSTVVRYPESKCSSKSSKSSKKSVASLKILQERLSVLEEKQKVIQEKEELLKQIEQMTVDEENENHENNHESENEEEEEEKEQKVPIMPPPHQTQQRKVDEKVVTESLTNNQLAARGSFSKDLPTFRGFSEEWPIFISTYQRTTELCGFSNDENLIRLERALKGDAREKVASQLILPSCVPNIIRTLEMIYGRPEHIIKNQIDKIRKLQPVRIDKIETLVNLSVSVDNICATMEASKLTTHINNPLLLDELLEKFPNDYKINWSRFSSRMPTVNLITFQEWLHEEAEHACRVANLTANTQKVTKGRINVHVNEQKSSPKPEYKCVSCKSKCESLDKCPKFVKLSIVQRWDVVKENKICRCCLKKHTSKFPYKCHEAKVCNIDGCPAKHNQLLHNAIKDEKEKPQTKPNEEFCGNHSSGNNKTQFRYLPVKLFNNFNSIETIAFLDEGSSGTYIDEELAAKLNLSGPKSSLRLKWTNDQIRVEQNSMKVSCDISGTYKNAPAFTLTNIQTVEKLNLPRQDLDYKEYCDKYSYLGKLPIQSYENGNPRILIGLNNWRCAVPLKVREGDSKDPIATKCRLGWTIYATGNSEVMHSCNFHSLETEENLDEMVKNYFSIDSLGVKIPKHDVASKEEQRARDIMKATTRRVGNRFETGLLWKYDDLNLPDSRFMALHRLKILEKRLNSDENLRVNIQKQLDDYLEKGYIRKLSTQELEKSHRNVWYLPIFPTVNPNKPEKTRIVWDAKAQVNGISLNSALLKGPDQLSSLYGILVRFREGKIAVVGDIAEMFHQVKIIPDDQHAQRFLWRNSKKNNQIEEYVMTVMTFGASCSPASAQYVKNLNAQHFKDEFPRAYNSIVYNHYVDDMLDSCNNVQQTLDLVDQVKNIHQSGGFCIRKWKSNSKEVMKVIGENVNPEQNVNLEMEETYEKVLGLWWNTEKDTFTYSLRFNKGNADVLKGIVVPTKREILRILMSIYDPLGLITHYLSYLKCLMQEIWSAGIDWDEKVNDQIFQKWLRWVEQLPTVENLNVPRCYSRTFENLDDVNKQLHVFVDASKNNCAAVAYIRLENQGNIEITLVSAKSKVAPVKLKSIPTLELVAAQIGARLAVSVKDSFSFAVDEIFFWTDSSTVMNWLYSDAKGIKGQFIAFRTAEIQDISSIKSWNLLPSKFNVADDATKWGTNLAVTIESRWFQGPQFLQKQREEWPKRKFVPKIDENVAKLMAFHTTVVSLVEFERFSNYNRLLRAVAYVYRYVHILYYRTKNQPCEVLTLSSKKNQSHQVRTFSSSEVKKVRTLSSSELKKAEIFILKQVQKSHYQQELITLSDGSVVLHGELSQLNPKLDEDGLIRAEGRYKREIYPICLPRRHHVTNLIVQKRHEKYLHQHNETVVNELRQSYHIPKLRPVLKYVINRCQMCKIKKAKPHPPMMSSLPSCRLASFEPPFSHCGVDYFGPLQVKVGRHMEKRWGCLFTCLTTRAIHIEIAHKLDTESFLLCFRNFTNRRGPVQHMYSDNGTNFVGAEKVLKQALKEIDFNTIATEFVSPTFNWHFNPPASPHFGGVWERLVKSVKTALYAINPFHSWSDDTLNSYLIEVEDIINSRPLTYLPLDTEESEALTPNYFIKGIGSSIPIGNIRDDAKFMKSNWQNSQLLKQRFWKRWITEYLPTLTRREKWCEPAKPLAVDDVVLIIDPNLTRNTYVRGKIVRVNQAADGQVRSAEVLTKGGILTRPSVNLAKLDVTSQGEKC